MSDSEVLHLLKKFSPFDNLDDHYVKRVAAHCQLLEVEKGKLLFRRGKYAEHRYYLLQGSVDLVGVDFTKESVAAGQPRAKQPLTETSPTQVSAVTKTAAKLLQVEVDFLDLALVWSQAGGAQMLDEVDPLTHLNLSKAQVQVEEVQGDWMSGLLGSHLFTKLPPAHIQQLFICFERLPVQAGEQIVREGETGDFFYVVDKGTAQVTNMTGAVDVTLAAGQYFGEEALVAEAPRNATVTMTSDGVLMRLGKEDFIRLLHEPVQASMTFAQYRSQQDHCVLLDVRMPVEHRLHHVPESRNLPLAHLRRRMPELDSQKRYLVTDDAGRRSQLAAYLLCQAGFDARVLVAAEQHYS